MSAMWSHVCMHVHVFFFFFSNTQFRTKRPNSMVFSRSYFVHKLHVYWCTGRKVFASVCAHAAMCVCWLVFFALSSLISGTGGMYMCLADRDILL